MKPLAANKVDLDFKSLSNSTRSEALTKTLSEITLTLKALKTVNVKAINEIAQTIKAVKEC